MEWRLFAHTGHRRDVVCWAKAAETELTDAEIDGIAAHEMGHIVSWELRLPHHDRCRFRGQVTQEVEDEANETAAKMGMPVIYNARKLEEVTPQT
jgi:hypothetical protein